MSVNDVKPGIYVSLVKIASLFATKMKDKISQVSAPRAIKEATYIDSPMENENGQSIDIVIDLLKAPMAGAYEWGSGEHATRGEVGKYPIPREGTTLMVFPASKWPNRKFNDDPIHITHAMHPGVAPRPYIQPTIEETEQEVLQILATEFKASILRGETRIEVIK